MSNGLIAYSQICRLKLTDAISLANSSNKLLYGTMTVGDLLVQGEIATLKFVGFNSVENFGRGIYIIYEKANPIYVGLANFHFFHRFSSHIHIDKRINWGWNALLLKLAIRETGKKKEELVLEDYNKALKTLYKCEIVRISLPTRANNINIRNLEAVFQRGMKHITPRTLLNGRVRKVKPEYLETEVSQLI
jgi:hypothetical protein